MEGESFEGRVKRLFGSHLFDTVPRSSFPASSWSVADGEVERREWNRQTGVEGSDDDRGETPCSSAFYEPGGCFAKAWQEPRDLKEEFEADLDNLDDDADEEGGGEDIEGDSDGEERMIRSGVGLDPTLDREEEEDDFDRRALGKEGVFDRMYMREVLDSGHHLNFNTVVPELHDDSYEMHDFDRDLRADHTAARARLREDENSAEQGPRSPLQSKQQAPPVSLQVKVADDNINLRPILKRKESHADEKPKKRVRFDSECKDNCSQFGGDAEYSQIVPQSMESLGSHGVPDYIRNPSKYTRYSLDTPDYGDEDEANKKAFEDFRSLVKRSNPDNTPLEFPVDLPGSVAFIPRKKLSDAIMRVDEGQKHSEEGPPKSCYVGIAAGDAGETVACEMEEDDEEVSMAEHPVMSKKAARRYRSKASDDSA